MWEISVGVVVTFVWIFLLFNSSAYVPSDKVDFWTITIISYLTMLALVLGTADGRSRFFDVRFVDFVFRFVFYFIPFFLIFGFLFGKFGGDSEGLFGILSVLPTWLIFIHISMFVLIESNVQVWAEENTKLRRLGTSLVFGALHTLVWSGSALLNFFLASLLFLFFSFINWNFRKNKNDLAPLCAVHGGYNVAQIVMS